MTRFLCIDLVCTTLARLFSPYFLETEFLREPGECVDDLQVAEILPSPPQALLAISPTSHGSFCSVVSWAMLNSSHGHVCLGATFQITLC